MLRGQVDYFNIDDLTRNLKHHAVRSGGITYLSYLVSFMLQTAGTLVLARILTPTDFGRVAMVTALNGFLVIFVDLGLTDATIQSKEVTHQQVSSLLWINAGITAVIVLLVVLLSPVVAWTYGEPLLRDIAIVDATYLFFSALSTQHIALLKRRMLFLRVSIVDTTSVLLSSGLSVIMALYGWGYWALVLRQVLLGIIRSTGAWIVCHWRPSLHVSLPEVRSMLSFGRNAIGYFIANYFARNLDKVLIGWSYGPLELGFYHRAYSLFVLPTTQLTTALQNVGTSTLSKLRYEEERYRKYYLGAISVLSFVGMPLGAFFMVKSEDVVFLLLGPQWGGTVEIFRILSAGTGIWVVYSTLYWLHASLGNTARLLRWGIVACIVNAVGVVCSLTFGPRWVAAMWTFSLYVLSGFGLHYAGRPIGLNFGAIVSVVWKYFVASTFAGLLCWYVIGKVELSSCRLLRLLISAGFFGVIYLIFVIALHRGMGPISTIGALSREILGGSGAKDESLTHFVG